MDVIVTEADGKVRVEEMNTPRLGFDHPYAEGAAREIAGLIAKAARVVADGGAVRVTWPDGRVSEIDGAAR